MIYFPDRLIQRQPIFNGRFLINVFDALISVCWHQFYYCVIELLWPALASHGNHDTKQHRISPFLNTK